MIWKTKKLSQVCDIQSGLWKGKKEPFSEAYVLRNTNFTPNGKFDYSNVVVLNVETNQLEKRLVKPLDIILEKSGGGENTPVGRVCLHTSELDKHVSFSNFTARLRVYNEKELDPEFLHRFLHFLYISGKTEAMQRNSTGIRNLQINQYKGIDVPLPPITEQHRLVAKLDNSFIEIDKQIKLIDLKKNNLFKFKDSILSQVLKIKGRENCKLGDVAKVIAGQSPKGEYYNKVKLGMPFYQGKKDFGSRYLNPPTVWTKSVTKIAEKMDILISVRAPVGALNITKENICIGRGLAAIRVSKKILNDYLFYSILNVRNSIKENSGAVFNSINKSQIEDIRLFLTNIDEQKKIVNKIDKIYEEIDKLIYLLDKNRQNYISLRNSTFSKELQNVAA